jgi:Cu2+-exporting ATPase
VDHGVHGPASLASLTELARWVEGCGMHCAGRFVPTHLRAPMGEPDPDEAHRVAVNALLFRRLR